MAGLKALTAVGVVVCVALTGALANSRARQRQGAPADAVTTHLLQIVDDNDQIRCIATTGKDGSAQITLLGKDGKVRLALVARDNGESVVSLAGAGSGSAYMMLDKSGSPSVRMTDSTGHARTVRP